MSSKVTRLLTLIGTLLAGTLCAQTPTKIVKVWSGGPDSGRTDPNPLKHLWTDTGLYLSQNGPVTITAAGSWNWGGGYPDNGPDGSPYYSGDWDKFFAPAPGASLIAYVGNDPTQGQVANNTFFPQSTGYMEIGSFYQFLSPVAGKLWLGFNDDAIVGDTDNSGAVTAVIYTRIVCPPPYITQQPPITFAVCPPNPITLSVIAAGEPPLTYQWKKDGQVLTDHQTPWGSVINGSTTSTLTIDSTSANDLGSYQVLITDPCGSTTSRSTKVTGDLNFTQLAPPLITTCLGSTVQLQVQMDCSANTAFQWTKNGQPITQDGYTPWGSYLAGSQASTLNIFTCGAGDSGAYSVTVTGPVGSTNSPATSLKVINCANLSQHIAVGDGWTMALDSSGQVWTWGDNSAGQLGIGSSFGNTYSSATPVQVPSLSGIVAVAAGWRHALALGADGTVWAWGNNDSGQVGPAGLDTTVPNMVYGLPANVVAICAGVSSDSSYALTSDGQIWAWGNNGSGQLGDGTVNNSSTPVRAQPQLQGVTAIAAGSAHCLALTSDGSVWAWGSDWLGQLGNMSFTQDPVPQAQQVSFARGTGDPPTPPITSIAGGGNFSLFLGNDGSLWGCGDGEVLNTPGNMSYAVKVIPDSVTSATGGHYHAVAVKSDGTAWAWGFGSLGDGQTTDTSPTPVQVGSLWQVLATSASFYNDAALVLDPYYSGISVYTWGDTPYPVQVTGFHF